MEGVTEEKERDDSIQSTKVRPPATKDRLPRCQPFSFLSAKSRSQTNFSLLLHLIDSTSNYRPPMSTFGTLFRVTTYGESHCASVGAIIDGCPPVCFFRSLFDGSGVLIPLMGWGCRECH